jgi:lysozyme family protein
VNFESAIERVLAQEGGYVNHPDDPGGETQWGISKRSYPSLDIKALTRDQAKAIYQRDFWARIHADELPGAIAFAALDFAVNSGIETAVRYLQRVLGVADDGHWGAVTKAAAASANEAKTLLRYLAERLDFMRRSSKWPVFGNGWAGRIAQDLRYAAQDI